VPEGVAEYDVTVKANAWGPVRAWEFYGASAGSGKRVKFYLGGFPAADRNTSTRKVTGILKSTWKRRVVPTGSSPKSSTGFQGQDRSRGRRPFGHPLDRRPARIDRSAQKNFKIGCHNSEFEITRGLTLSCPQTPMERIRAPQRQTLPPPLTTTHPLRKATNLDGPATAQAEPAVSARRR